MSPEETNAHKKRVTELESEINDWILGVA